MNRFILLLAICILFSCKKEPEAPPVKVKIQQVSGMYVLNEGLMNMNNTELTYYNFSDSNTYDNFYSTENGRKLGDTGNDIGIYGTKIYIAVFGSSQIEVIEAKTGKSLKQIPVFDNNKPRKPRKIAFYKNKALVCNFDGTLAIIDTASLEIENYLTLGRNPDGIAVVANKAYISNSGGLDAPNYDSTISVIQLDSMKEIKKIAVGINPYNIVPDDYGDLYVISRGDYEKVKMSLQVIDTKKDKVKYVFPKLEALNLAIMRDTAYVYYYDFNSGSGSKIMLINVRNETVISQNFISDNTQIKTIYGIATDSTTSRIFISDANGFVNTGSVYCFNSRGEKLFSFHTGLNPSKMIFVY